MARLEQDVIHRRVRTPIDASYSRLRVFTHYLSFLPESIPEPPIEVLGQPIYEILPEEIQANFVDFVSLIDGNCPGSQSFKQDINDRYATLLSTPQETPGYGEDNDIFMHLTGIDVRDFLTKGTIFGAHGVKRYERRAYCEGMFVLGRLEQGLPPFGIEDVPLEQQREKMKHWSQDYISRYGHPPPSNIWSVIKYEG